MSLNRMVSDLEREKKPWFPLFSTLSAYGNLSKPAFFKLFDVKIAPIFSMVQNYGVQKYMLVSKVSK